MASRTFTGLLAILRLLISVFHLLESTGVSKRVAGVSQITFACCPTECSSADSLHIPQLKRSHGPLNGLFMDNNARNKSPEKEEEDKVRLPC